MSAGRNTRNGAADLRQRPRTMPGGKLEPPGNSPWQAAIQLLESADCAGLGILSLRSANFYHIFESVCGYPHEQLATGWRQVTGERDGYRFDAIGIGSARHLTGRGAAPSYQVGGGQHGVRQT